MHPDAVDLLRGNLMRQPIGGDPDLQRQVANYLAVQNDLFRRFHAARTTTERDQIIAELVHHADRNSDLIDQMARHQSTRANSATDPRRQARDQDGQTAPAAKPTARRRTTAPAKTPKGTSTAQNTTSTGRARPTP